MKLSGVSMPVRWLLIGYLTLSIISSTANIIPAIAANGSVPKTMLLENIFIKALFARHLLIESLTNRTIIVIFINGL